ncbi:prepilin peptidase [Leucobacter sp. GX24907]
MEIVAWWVAGAAFVLCAAWSVRLAWIDLVARRLPNPDVSVISIGTAVPLTVAAMLAGQWERVGGGLFGAAVVCAPMLVLWAVPRGVMRPVIGAGDVKLAPIIGFLPGWVFGAEVGAALFAVFLGLGIFGAVGAVIALVRHGRGTEFAFGPVMLAAMWFASLVWPWIAVG